MLASCSSPITGKENFTIEERETRNVSIGANARKKTVRQELTPADTYDFAAISKAKQELEAKGWIP
jgi:hypothetical protein